MTISTRTLFAAVTCATVLSSLSRSAFGQDATAEDATTEDAATEVSADQAAGRELFARALELYDAGDFPAACAKFEESLAQYAGLGTRGKLAQCYERVDKLADALSQYEEVAKLAGAAGQEARERVARARSEALAEQVPRLIVQVPQFARVEGLAIRIGDQLLTADRYDIEAPYNAGTYVVTASAPGHDAWKQTAELKNYRSIRIIIPKLSQQAAAPVPPVAPPPAAKEPPPPAPEPAPTSERPWQMPVGVALTGIGAVGLVVGGVLAGSASSKYDEAFESDCDADTLECNSDGFQKTEDARGLADASTGLFIGGAVMAAVGITVWVTAPASPNGSDSAIRVSPGRLDVVGRF